jgi:hypothetical protein
MDYLTSVSEKGRLRFADTPRCLPLIIFRRFGEMR